MKKHILIIYTGGTIGMEGSEQGYVPTDGFASRLDTLLSARATDRLPAYSMIELERLIDSANLVPNDWSHIAQQLVENWDMYDGFVVLHGTDTMAYTASALSFMLRGIDKPVIVTGSQIPLAEVRNDALDNLVSSLILAGNFPVPEVCIYFNGKLLRGNRSTKLKSVGLDAFDSPNYPALAEVGIHVNLRQELLLKQQAKTSFNLKPFEQESVVAIQVFPGISAKVIDALLQGDGVRALILQTYGVGNPPGNNKAFIERLRQAHEDGIVVVNLSQCLYGGVYQGAYATGDAFNQIGIVPGSDLTLEAAFTKLHCLISEGYSNEEIRRLMPESICGECTQSLNAN
ncbi:MAG: asparaginase [Neptuniibacter sp.]